MALRRGSLFRYEFRVHRYVPPEGLSRREGERRLVMAYHAQLESWIREAPEQYFWLRRRWRTRPAEEAAALGTPTYDRRGRVRA